MKKLIFLSIIFAFLTPALQSCKKDDPEPDTTPAELFKLTDNGTPYETSHIIKRHQDGFIGAGAPNSFTSAYGIAMPEGIMPGTYELSPTSFVQVTKTEDSGSLTYTAQSGSMTITAHDTAADYISGTFSGVIAVQGTSQTRTITGGQFSFGY